MLALSCDVADAEAVNRAFTTIEETFGAPSILVNNAAVLGPSGVLNTSAEDWEQVMAVNVTGAFHCIQRALPAMQANGYGRIINIGSNAGKMGSHSGVVAYAASKAALHNLTRAIAAEAAPHGITINALAPAMIDSAMAQSPDTEKYAEMVLVGRMGTPEDVAYVALFLASSAASYITAEVIDVNGGFHID